jgi:hypothetical protein
MSPSTLEGYLLDKGIMINSATQTCAEHSWETRLRQNIVKCTVSYKVQASGFKEWGCICYVVYRLNTRNACDENSHIRSWINNNE